MVLALENSYRRTTRMKLLDLSKKLGMGFEDLDDLDACNDLSDECIWLLADNISFVFQVLCKRFSDKTVFESLRVCWDFNERGPAFAQLEDSKKREISKGFLLAFHSMNLMEELDVSLSEVLFCD